MNYASSPTDDDGAQDAHPHDQCLDPKFVVGYNGEEVGNNLIWNEKEGWMLFSTRRKVIYESLKDKTHVVVYEGNS